MRIKPAAPHGTNFAYGALLSGLVSGFLLFADSLVGPSSLR